MVTGGRLQFATVKSSHGMSVATAFRNGKFFAPEAGFYIVLSNILTTSQSVYYIKKNGISMAQAYSHYYDSNKSSKYSAPLHAFMELSVNDVITIEGEPPDSSSCLTIIHL